MRRVEGSRMYEYGWIEYLVAEEESRQYIRVGLSRTAGGAMRWMDGEAT